MIKNAYQLLEDVENYLIMKGFNIEKSFYIICSCGKTNFYGVKSCFNCKKLF